MDANEKASAEHEVNSQLPCSALTAFGLYESLEYYREYAPYMLGMEPDEYAKTLEAKKTDSVLAKYREETGAKATYPM